MRLRTLALTALAATLVGPLAACGSQNQTPESEPLRVIADVIPHAELLKQAEEQGLLGDVKIEVTEIAGDVDPNQLVNAGDLDANFFQHVPYLTDWNASHDGSDLVEVATVHVEPLGLYSKKADSLAAIPTDATVAIPADPTNQARALFLLQDAGLITLDVKPTDANLDYSQITEANITENPRNLQWLKIDRPQLAASLDDPQVNSAVVNGNYALEAGLIPASDALALEQAEGNPYANVLVVKQELAEDPRVTKLAEALESPELAQWITDNYQGSVLPVNG